MERERDLRERMALDEELRGGAPQWVRDEQGGGVGLAGPGIPRGGRSRSDTPVSNDASRPPSGQSYDRAADTRDQRSSRGAYATSSRNLLGLDNSEYAYDPREREERERGHGSSADSRKRSRNDMEVDDGGRDRERERERDRDRDRERERDRDRDRERERDRSAAAAAAGVDPRYAAEQGPGSSSAARMEDGYKDNRGGKRMHHDDRERERERERDGQMSSSVRDDGPMDEDD